MLKELKMLVMLEVRLWKMKRLLRRDHMYLKSGTRVPDTPKEFFRTATAVDLGKRIRVCRVSCSKGYCHDARMFMSQIDEKLNGKAAVMPAIRSRASIEFPDKKEILEGEDVECFTANDMNRAYNEAIDDCRKYSARLNPVDLSEEMKDELDRQLDRIKKFTKEMGDVLTTGEIAEVGSGEGF